MSDFPESPQNTFVNPQMVEKRGMGSGAKVLIILGIVFLLCVLVCCGGGILFSFMASAYVKDAFTDDPAKIEQRRAEVLDVKIPEPFTPQVSLDMKVPMSDDRFMMYVVYQGPSSEETIVLVEVGKLLAESSQDNMEQEIENSLHDQGIGQPTPGVNWEITSKEYTIGGEKVTFTFRTEKDEDGEPVRFHTTGMVPGKRDPVFVIITAEAKTLSEEQIDEIIQSIKK